MPSLAVVALATLEPSAAASSGDATCAGVCGAAPSAGEALIVAATVVGASGELLESWHAPRAQQSPAEAKKMRCVERPVLTRLLYTPKPIPAKKCAARPSSAVVRTLASS